MAWPIKISTGNDGSGKNLARDGHIVIDGRGRTGRHYIFGNISANGDVIYQDGNDEITLTSGNADSYLAGYEGNISQNLLGTNGEIPDFTNLGGDEQLFDFERYQIGRASCRERV